ncbi:MAG: translation initiation factor IF-2 [Actinomycetes bacterium]
MYELARELGLTNKETLDLCDALGIGVKSHSSSVVDPQADRVRRKAKNEGLVRDVQPPEPDAKPAKKAAAKATKATKASKKTAIAAKPAADPALAEAEPAVAEGETPTIEAAPQPEVQPAPTAPEAPAPPPVAEPAAVPAPAARPKRVVTSSGSEHPPRPAAQVEPVAPASAEPAPRSPADVVPPAAEVEAPPESPSKRPADDTASDAPAVPTGQPMARSGRAIPPPPRPPTSVSGKPIPPPPGVTRRPTAETTGRGPGGAAPQRRGGSDGGSSTGTRPSGGPGASRPGSSPSGPSGPGGPGGPGSSPGGRPGGGRGGPGGNRRAPRRKGRRRRNRDELQPMSAPSYTPANAPTPTGEVVIERASTAQELGPKFNRTTADVVRFLMEQGEMVTATQSLSDDMVELFAAELGIEIRMVDPGEEQEVELLKLLDLDFLEDDDDAPQRAPVITVMGHVDHGKTKLLDQIRNANVVAGEAGGITQHIGAYQVIKNDKPITFIDTPGHEAFSAMRARGAEATDIVVLVVAADDGVMPQTIEALDHARAAEVPIVVAINKIDRENADPTRVMTQLAERGLQPEEWSGDTVMVQVSALENLGIDDLLENLQVIAELEDLRGNVDGRAVGTVLESKLDIGRGPVATVLVQQGTLRVGDPLVAGAAWGRVRALINDRGEQIKQAGPSTPVQVLGLSEVAQAGDRFVVAPDERTASKVAATREHWQRQATLGRDAHAMSGGAKLEDIFQQIQAGEAATLNLIVKADVTGSLEALTESLRRLERDEVKLAFVRRGVGGITKDDIQLAATSNATIIGFNVRPDRNAREMADQEKVEIRTYEIIYQVIEDIQNAVLGLLQPEFEEIVTGDAEVREIFRVPRVGAIAGCYVLNGTITRNSKVRFLREGTIIWKGAVQSLRRFKEDVREVQAGFECGIGLTDFQDLKPGDIIETYEDREIPRS